jgi:hypothetical protein
VWTSASARCLRIANRPADRSDPGLASVTGGSGSSPETRKGSNMIARLTDLQLAVLSAAAARDDKCVQLPPTLRGALLRKAGEKLIDAGYVREVKAKPSSPVWRGDDATGATYALKLTAAGAQLVREGEAAGVALRQSEPSARSRRAAPSPVAAHPARGSKPQPETNASPLALERKAPSGAPRAGSKIADVIALLERESGATLREVADATGWLSHTTRAAFTGLRKRGYKVVSDRSDRERGSLYRIEAQTAAAQLGPAHSVAEAP